MSLELSPSGPCRRRPVALLVLLARAARARVVSSDLRLVALEGLDLRVAAARSRRAVGVVDVARLTGRHRGRRAPGLRLRDLSFGFSHDRLKAEEPLDELVL